MDNDGNEEVIVESPRRCWWLRIEGDKWVAEEMPIKRLEHEVDNNKKLKIVLFVIQHGQLLLLRKRGQWMWQRIAENVENALVTDLDGDGKWDDLIMLKLHPRCQVIWFEVDSEGYAHFRGDISFPNPKPPRNNIWLENREQAVVVNIANSGNGIYTVWVWDGRLKGDEGEWICWREDLNSDGKVDLIRMSKEHQKPLKVVASLGGRGEEISLTITKFSWGEPFCFGDFDGDGWRELIVLAESYPTSLLRFWIEGGQQQSEQTRFRTERILLHGVFFGMNETFAGTIHVGDRDWLLFWNREQGKLIAFWREKSGWKRKTWRFRVTPWSTIYDARVEQDDKGWVLVAERIWSPEQHPFWRRWLQIVEKLRQNKVPVPLFLLPPREERFRQVWRWDERKLSWRLEQPVHEKDRFLRQVGGYIYDLVIPIDLNKDGQEEKLICEGHTGNWGYLAVKVGRLWKRWRIIPLWKEQHFPFVILNQREKTWVIGLDCVTRVGGITKRILKAWTLEK